jgi:hypothetical protein
LRKPNLETVDLHAAMTLSMAEKGVAYFPELAKRGFPVE